jgi:hypothetical protein
MSEQPPPLEEERIDPIKRADELARFVLIESPYQGEIARNKTYARAAARDCMNRGETPLAAHLLYTQPGITDDTIPEERAEGIAAGLRWLKIVNCAVVYRDLGITPGMKEGIAKARALGVPIEFRNLPNWERPHGSRETY